MRKHPEYLFRQSSRDPLRITGYRFGRGDKSVCIVGAMRGNEVQQLYICSQLVHILEQFEKRGLLLKGNEILVVPSVNHYSMNIGKRFWAMDNSDINRMYPGDDCGEATQRIAAGVFEKVQGYRYGIQFALFYMPGDFIPHVRMDELRSVMSPSGGIFVRSKHPGDEVSYGDELAKIIHPLEGYVLNDICAPCDGIVFFSHSAPLINQQTTAFRIIRRIHG